MTRRMVVALVAAVALAGCSSSGGNTAPTDTTATTAGATTVSAEEPVFSDGAVDPDTTESPSDTVTTAGEGTVPTIESTRPIEEYDEAEQTPIADLPDRLTEVIGAQGGDVDANNCVIEAVLAANEAGDLSPFDLDAYVRLSAVTGTMLTFLQELQVEGTCQPT